MAQTNSVIIKGRLLNAFTKEEVPFANIYFKNTKRVIASNDSGYFHAKVVFNDTIVITSIGYCDFEAYLPDIIKDSTDNIIELIPTVYQLAEVEIRALPTYSQLKRLIATAKPSREEEQQNLFYKNLERLNIPKVESLLGLPSNASPGQIVLLGIGIGRNIESKSRMKVNYLRNYDKRKNKIKKKYSPIVVGRLTGLKDGKTIKEFMQYCNFTDDFVLLTAEYDLYCLIVKKYQEFKKNRALAS